MIDFKLKFSHPSLTQDSLDRLEKELKIQFDYPSIPTDYKQYLLKHNGGFISPGYVDDAIDSEEEHTHEVVLDTTLKTVKADNKPYISPIISFFGVWLDGMTSEGKNQNVEEFAEYLPDIIASNEHSRFDFDVLPTGLMSFAACQHPETDDLMAMSLNEADYGSIYYYYGMWYYPMRFMGYIYDNKIDTIINKYGLDIAPFAENCSVTAKIDIVHSAIKDNAQADEIEFELDMIPFVKVADSFTELLEKLYIEEVDHD